MKNDFKHKMVSSVEEDNMYRQGRTKEKWESMLQFQEYTITYGGGIMILLYILSKLQVF
jgi:hypothetical protein